MVLQGLAGVFRVQAVQRHVALVLGALLERRLGEALVDLLAVSPANHGRKAVANVRMVQELCTYSSISLFTIRTLARCSRSRGMSGGSGNASSR